MADRAIISWNATNWITIVLMAAVGFAVVGFGMKLYQNRKAKAA